MNDTRVPFNRKNPNNRNLQLQELEGRQERITFTIDDEILRDEESITYLAKSGKKTGYLREFYPSSALQKANGYLLVRNIDNNVQFDKEDKTSRPDLNFDADNDKFTDFLKVVQHLRSSDSKEDSFFPDSTLFICTDIKSCHPAYSWTERDPNKQFLNEYIENFKISATANEKKLRPVLMLLKSLIDLELDFLKKFEKFKASLEPVYLDLDKNNFLVTKNKKFVEMSDLEVINPVLLEGKSAKKDLFSSLGNLLLECLQSEPYKAKTKALRLYIDQSEIIGNSDLKYEYIIKEKLTDFLEIAYSNKKKRDLKDMADLLKDIIQILKRPKYYQKLKTKGNEVKDINSKTFVQHRKNVIDALVKNPVSKVVTLTDNDPINVLIIGFGLNGQATLDDILPILQLRNHPLNVTIFDKRIDELYEDYFGAREGLLDYLEIEKITNGEVKKNEPEKALSGIHLRFENPDEYGCDFSNKALDYKKGLQNILLPEDGKTYNYIFISLGDNQTTKEVGKEAKKIVKNKYPEGQKTAFTHFLTGDSDQNPEEAKDFTLYYYMGNYMDNWKNFELKPLLRRMALNIFYLWKNPSNPNLEKLESTFKKDYYETAAYTSALGLLLNLDTLDASDFPKNPKAGTKLKKVKHLDAFKSAIVERMGQFLYDSLENGTFTEALIEEFAYWDHRNWMLSRLCFGWKHPDNWDNTSLVSYLNSDFFSNNGKDEENHYLVTLVDSGFTNHLKTKTKDFWLNATDKDLEELDDLEKASVKIFQGARSKHQQVFGNADLYSLEYQILQKRIEYTTRAASSSEEGEALIDLYNRFIYCVTNIQNGSRSYLKSFDLYLNAFKDKLKQVSEKTYKEVLPIIDNIEETTRLTKKSVQMTNFKDTNRRVIKNLPFVLSYTHEFELASYLNFDAAPITSAEIFKNVNAASVLLPRKATYFYRWRKDISQEEFFKKFTTILDYFDERNVDSEIYLWIQAPDTDLDWLEDKLTALKEERKNFNYKISQSQKDLKGEMLNYPKTRKKGPGKVIFDLSHPYFSSPLKQNSFIDLILINEIPWFLFDSRTLQFKTAPGFEFLKYTYLDNLHIRAKELFTLSNKKKNKLRAIELIDELEPLWDLYTGSYLLGKGKIANEERAIRTGVKTWNIFCNFVGDYFASKPYMNDHVFEINMTKKELIQPTKVSFYLPYACYNSVNFLLNLFKDEGLIAEDSYVKSGLSDSFCLTLSFKNISEEGYKTITRLFRHPELLTDPRNIIHYEVKDYLRVELRTNSDIELNFKELGPPLNYYAKLLARQLKRRGYLTRYEEIDQNKIKFSFTSNRYRNLLSQGGAMLEVYTFYKLLNSSFFDDIISGYTVLEEKTNQEENEIDLILTKDFHTYFLECKGTGALERIYYPKIKALADHYGVNERAALIFLSSSLEDSEEKLGALIEYGKENRVETIQLNDDFTNLETRLEKIYKEDQSKNDYWE